MKRLTLLIMLLVTAPQSYAWSVSGLISFPAGKGVVAVTGYSSRLEILVHRLKVTAVIKEEGQVVDTVSKTCNITVNEFGLPEDMWCTEKAIDTSLTDTCFYCGNGTAEAFTFVATYISLGTKFWGDCRVYNAGPGNR